jgi:hypothetical protein
VWWQAHTRLCCWLRRRGMSSLTSTALHSPAHTEWACTAQQRMSGVAVWVGVRAHREAAAALDMAASRPARSLGAGEVAAAAAALRARAKSARADLRVKLLHNAGVSADLRQRNIATNKAYFGEDARARPLPCRLLDVPAHACRVFGVSSGDILAPCRQESQMKIR